MPHRNQTIFDQGWKAWTEGARGSENPYRLGFQVDEYAAWRDGWLAAEEDYKEQEQERDDFGDRVDYEYEKWRE